MEQKHSASENSIKNKIAVAITGRIKKEKNIENAIEIQDRLAKKSGSWNGSQEIIKWRSQH
jgi:hypothetical protein